MVGRQAHTLWTCVELVVLLRLLTRIAEKSALWELHGSASVRDAVSLLTDGKGGDQPTRSKARWRRLATLFGLFLMQSAGWPGIILTLYFETAPPARVASELHQHFGVPTTIKPKPRKHQQQRNAATM